PCLIPYSTYEILR
ncbi:hypothetical protein CP8484711_1408B, partial [Chlamydia psittaci 84-8471/1]